MHMDNIHVMVNVFCTTEEGMFFINVFADNGLKQGENSLKIWCMYKLTSNVFAIDDLSEVFDGFRIVSNDLTHIVLGCDRESAYIYPLFEESDRFIKYTIKASIKGSHRHGLPVGLLGHASSDNSDFSTFLVEKGIESISVATA